MKKFIALVLAFVMLLGGCVISEEATPTDLMPIEEEELVEIDDDDWGEITVAMFERRVYIVIEKEPKYFDDTMTLTAVLVDF